MSRYPYQIREDWVVRVPGMEMKTAQTPSAHSTTAAQYLVTYEPGDATRYEMGFIPAHLAGFTSLGCGELPWWQVTLWTGSTTGVGTMLVEAGVDGTCVSDLDRTGRQLRCTEHSARVAVILIHGCLASHDRNVARETIAKFRIQGRNGFVDPDDTSALRE